MEIKLFDEKCLPRYSNENDSGMDVFAEKKQSGL